MFEFYFFFQIKTHNWGPAPLLLGIFAANIMLTHFFDSRQLVSTRELYQLSVLPPFHPWKPRLLLFRSSSNCVQPGRLSEPPPGLLLLLLPSFLSPLWHPGAGLWWSLLLFQSFQSLSLCTLGCLVMYISTVAASSTHTDKHTLRHPHFCLPHQRNHCRVQKSRVLSWVCHSRCWVGDFSRELYYVLAGTETYLCTPESALAWLDHCRGVGGWRVVVRLQKQAWPSSGRKEEAWSVPLWSDVRKYWEAAPEGSLKTRQEWWEEGGTWPASGAREEPVDLFSHIHNMTRQREGYDSRDFRDQEKEVGMWAKKESYSKIHIPSLEILSFLAWV